MPVSLAERLEMYHESAQAREGDICRLECEKWVLQTGLVEDDSEQFRIMQCESGPLLNSEICNRKYGCIAGMGLWGFISSTWNETITRMSEEGTWMPERCWQLVYLPVSDWRGEPVFDAECNLLAGLWLYKTDGNIHWEQSKHCWDQ